MSVMGADDDVEQTQGHRGARVTHLADLVGRASPRPVRRRPRHGTIFIANYRLGAEAALIVHPDSRPSETPANTVLVGRPATWALDHLDAPDPLDVDAMVRSRLSAEQARTLPACDAPTLTVAR